MASLLDFANPEPGFEAMARPEYLRSFGGPGVSPSVHRDRNRDPYNDPPEPPHRAEMLTEFFSEYIATVEQMAQAPIERILSARGRTFLGHLGQELESMNLGAETLEALGIIAPRGGGRNGTGDGRERGGRSDGRDRARGRGDMPSAGGRSESHGVGGHRSGGRGRGAAHGGGRPGGGSRAAAPRQGRGDGSHTGQGGDRRAPGGGETPRYGDSSDRHHDQLAADSSGYDSDLIPELSDTEIEGGPDLIPAL